MPITKEELEARRHHIGSSDMPAILGLDPWRTAEDVRLEKLGRLIDRPASDAMNAGTWLEGGVLEFAKEKLGDIDHHPGTREVEGTLIQVNTDGLVIATGEPIEVKTAKLFGPSDEWWGEDGTDEVPDRVIIQAHCHMMAWNKPRCHVPVLLGGSGFRLYDIRRDAHVADVIVAMARTFWTENVLGDTPVRGSSATLEVVKRLRKQPEKICAIDPQIIQRWLDAKAMKSEAEKNADAAMAEVLAALGDAEAAMCGDLGAITYLQQTRKEHVVKESTFRVLRHKPKGL